MMRLLVVLGMIASVAAMAPDALTQSPMFSTRREVVRVDVLVSANGQPVKGLAPADFDVRDNGTRQEVELATFEEVPIDVTLALDMSRSVDGDRLEHLRRAGHSVVSALHPRDRAALVTFSHAVSQRAALTTDRAPVRAALDAATGEGETALIDGVYTSLVLGADQGAASSSSSATVSTPGAGCRPTRSSTPRNARGRLQRRHQQRRG